MHSLYQAGFALALLTAVGLGGQAQAQTFSIAANPNAGFTADPAQGFYYADGTNQPTNFSYFVGQVATSGVTPSNDPTHDYFTFDLSGLNLTGKKITSATLSLPNYFGTSDSGQKQFLYSLYDVTTDPTTLNADHSSAANPAIYNDLAGGTNYGMYDLPVSGPISVLSLTLDNAALTDISGSAGHDFSIGGVLALTNGSALPANSDEFLFAGSETLNQGQPTLTITTAPAVPEASTTVSLGLLLALGAGGLVIARRKRGAHLI